MAAEKVDIPMPSASELARELRDAARVLRTRGLKVATNWACEMLSGLADAEAHAQAPGAAGDDAGAGGAGGEEAGGTAAAEYAQADADVARAGDDDAFALARSYQDMSQFRRAAHVLEAHARESAGAGAGAGDGGDGGAGEEGAGPELSTALSGKTYFVRCYCRFMGGQLRQEQQRTEEADPLDRCATVLNEEAEDLAGELADARAGGRLDAFGLYILGVALKALDRRDEAVTALCESVAAFPLNWSAWVDLASLCADRDDLDALELPAHWARRVFMAHALLELQYNDDALEELRAVTASFPQSPFLQAQSAQALYNLRKFDRAEEAYTHIRRRDPYRLDGMDTYSNILYVKEAKEELGFLAHTAVQIDKYRPETCCIIGNYYSLRNEHEAAVTYFRRALAVNRKFLSAWTLMGHEYVEMKNTGAAIEAYRRAVDINPRDYRAWYGLGQTYEILRMFFYALHYYQKATALRPYDSRMWCAIAGCYEEMDRPQDAVKCYERAVGLNDREGIARLKLATLYTQSGDADNAYKFYSEHVEQQDRNGTAGDESTAEALLYMAGYAKDHGLLDLAESYATRLLALPYRVPEAKAVVREIRSVKHAGSTVAATEAIFGASADGGGDGSAAGASLSYSIWN